MEFIVTLFTAGVALLILGVIGRVEAFKIKAGTNNKKARIFFVILGGFFILWASTEYNIKTNDARMDRFKEQWLNHSK